MPDFAALRVAILGDTTEFAKSLKTTARELQVWSRSLTDIGATLSTAITLPLAGTAAAALKLSGELEQNRIAFTTMLGSADAARAELEKLRKFAQKTPFEFTDLVRAEKRLLALGFSAREVIPTLTAVGNAAAATGGGAEAIDRITLALGQIRSKGKVATQELNQLAEQGIPAFQILAKVLNTDVAGAMKAVEKGAVSAAVALPALIEGLNQRFAGLMEQQSTTLLGRLSNLKDAAVATLTRVGDALEPTAKRLLSIVEQTLLPAVEKAVRAFEDLPAPVKDASVAIVGLVAVSGPVIFALGQIVGAFSTISGAAGRLLAVIGPSGGIIAGLSRLSAVLAAVYIVGTQVASIWPEITRAFQTASEVSAQLAASVSRINAVLPVMTALFQVAGRGISQAMEAAHFPIKLIGNGLQQINDYLKSFTKQGFLDSAVGRDLERLNRINTTNPLSVAGPTASQLPPTAPISLPTKEVKEHKKAVEELNFAQQVLKAVEDKINESRKDSAKVIANLITAGEAYGKKIATVSSALGELTVFHSAEADAIRDQIRLYASFDPTVDAVAGRLRILQLESEAAFFGLSKFEIFKSRDSVFRQMAQDTTDITAIMKRFGLESEAASRKHAQAIKAALEQVKALAAVGLASVNDVIALQDALAKVQKEVNRTTGTVGSSASAAKKRLQEVSTVINDLASGFTDAILKAKSFGDAMDQVLDNVKRAILRKLLEEGINKLFDVLGSFLGKFGGILGKIGGIFGGGSSGGGIGGAVGGAASGAGGAAGSVASSGFASIAGLVTGAVSAVSGVIGNFQNARQETTLNAIELNTRKSSIFLGENGTESIHAFTKKASQFAEMSFGWISSTQHTLLVGMASTLDAIRDTLRDPRSGFNHQSLAAAGGGFSGDITINITMQGGLSDTTSARRLSEEIGRTLREKLGRRD